ncbi:CPBP family intramembrane glutamic endopeptidase [Flavobacterium sp. 11]|uniref:CPBP family intramembrane glutamic endopeptidase n=1 Tax=Flavobacterium sp. 11 TaxID=357523 RepID=UPI000C1A524B|nr:type II CAAX endopeptidase family protein [Flavobacterium sp. 11]PIF61148.1 CAAX prenyl protease-like protein [Flavobacterium sp. 11]
MNSSNWVFLIMANSLLFFILKFNDDLNKHRIINFVSIQQIKLYLIIALIFLVEYCFIDSGYYNIYGGSIRTFIISLYIFIICKNYFNNLFLLKIDLKKAFVIALVSLIFALLISNFQEYIFNLVNRKLPNDYGIYLSDYKILFGLIFYATLPAVFEEIFFRGLIFDKLKLIYSVKNTIIISSILFYLMHLIYGTFISILYVLPLGFFLGYLRNRYNNLIYPIASHFFYNFIVFLYPIIK